MQRPLCTPQVSTGNGITFAFLAGIDFHLRASLSFSRNVPGTTSQRHSIFPVGFLLIVFLITLFLYIHTGVISKLLKNITNFLILDIKNFPYYFSDLLKFYQSFMLPCVNLSRLWGTINLSQNSRERSEATVFQSLTGSWYLSYRLSLFCFRLKMTGEYLWFEGK